MLRNVVFARTLLRSNTSLIVFCATAFYLSIDDKKVIDFRRVMKSKGDAIRGFGAPEIMRAIAFALAVPVNAV
jgi:hypothetical protein